MRITTLVENRPSPADPALQAEWGLSQHVEIGGHRLLLDMGATDAFASNAALLGVDIGAVDAAVVSHHHYDHGGGLRRFLELNDQAPVYLAPTPAGEPTGRLPGAGDKPVGLDRQLMSEHAHRLRRVRDRTEILPGVFVLPDIGGRHPRPEGNRMLFIRSGEELTPDDFGHEVVVALQERGSVVVLTGCSHSGALNMIEKVRREFPGLPLKGLVGGLHLVGIPPLERPLDRENDIADVGRQFLEFGVESIWTGHCTCSRAFEVLRATTGPRVHQLHTGTVVEF